MRLHLGSRSCPVDLGGPPLLGVGPEGHPPSSRVEVSAAGQVRRHLGQKSLGVGLAVEGLVALAAGVVAPANVPSLALAVPSCGDLLAAVGSLDGAIPPVIDISHGRGLLRRSH
jgi:hypothetical protein